MNSVRQPSPPTFVLAIVAIVVLTLQSNSAQAQFAEPSSFCAGAIDIFDGEPDDPGPLMEVVIPPGTTVTCSATPSVEVTGIAPGASIINLAAELNAVLASGNHVVVNNGSMFVQIDGSNSNVTNNGGMDLNMTGDDTVVLNNATGDLEARIAGNDAMVTNEGNVSLFVLGGDSAEIVNNGTAGTTSALGASGFVVIGDGTMLTNSDSGIIEANSAESVGIEFEGDQNNIANAGTVLAAGVEATGIEIEGAENIIDNSRLISVGGLESSAILVEGAANEISNSGDIFVDGSLSTGIIALGALNQIENSGTVTLTNPSDTAAVAIGFSGFLNSVENSGAVSTTGRQSMGVGGIGLGGVENLEGGVVETNGDRSHGLFLGFQELDVPAGLSFPPSILDPASGIIDNAGTVRTFGDNSDAIHGFIDDSDPEDFDIGNAGTLTTQGTESHGISIVGSNIGVINVGEITTSGDESAGIEVTSDEGVASVFNGWEITTEGVNADGIRVIGPVVEIANSDIILTSGDRAEGIVAEGDIVEIINDFAVESRGDNAAAIRLAAPTGEGTLENNGLVTTRGQNSDGIRVEIAAGEIVNSNNGDVLATGDQSDGISYAGDAIDFTNRGVIEARGTFGSALRVEANTSTVTNTGSIEARGSAIVVDSTVESVQILNLVSPTNTNDVGTIVGEVGIEAIVGQGTAGPNTPINFSVRNESMIVAGQTGIVLQNQATDRVPGMDVSLLNGNAGEIFVDTSVSELQSSDAFGVVFGQTGDTTVENQGNVIVSNQRGGQSTGFDLSGFVDGQSDITHVFENSGTIAVDGGGSSTGVSLLSDRIFFNNDQDSEIIVIGQDATGVAGNFVLDATMTNDGTIAVTGPTGARGLALIHTETARDDAPTFSVINSGVIDVNGDNSLGMLVQANDGVADTTDGEIPTLRVLSNEDRIIVAGDNSTGMGGVNFDSVRFENAGTIEVEGNQSRGIGTITDDSLIFNGNIVNVEGDESFGVVVIGDDNIVLNGLQGVFCADPNCDVFTAVSGLIDIAQIPGGPPPPIINVNGANSVGLSITGNNNRVSNAFFDGNIGSDLDFGRGEIIATGAGSIGVTMNGSNNTFLNSSTISGDALGLRGGFERDAITNLGLISGGVQLLDGDDELTVAGGATFESGGVDAGEGEDTLIARAQAFLPGDAGIPGGDMFDLDGNDYNLFERFVTVGGGTVNLANNLTVEEALLTGTTNLVDGAMLAANQITIAAGSRLTGNGSVGRLPTGPGQFDDAEINILGNIGSGNSIGRIDFFGDLFFSGVMDIEIGGTTELLFDTIFVDGDLFFDDATINFFVDDEIGLVEDLLDELFTLDFLQVTGEILGTVAFDFFDFPGIANFQPVFSDAGLSLENGNFPDPTTVPAPGTIGLIAIGLALAGFRCKRRRYLH